MLQYMEYITLSLFVVGIIIVVFTVRQIIEKQKQIILQLNSINYQQQRINAHLSHVDNDMYILTQRSMKE